MGVSEWLMHEWMRRSVVPVVRMGGIVRVPTRQLEQRITELMEQQQPPARPG